GLAWAMAGAGVVCATAYERNLVGRFYLGLFLVALLLVLSKRILHLGAFCHQIANAALVFILALPIVDCLTRPAYLLDAAPDPSKKYYSFAGARKDPSAFRRWWFYYVKAWGSMGGRVYTPDPT